MAAPPVAGHRSATRGREAWQRGLDLRATPRSARVACPVSAQLLMEQWVDLGAELLHAAAHDETQRLESLITSGANLDAKGWLKNRPLHIACARAKLPAVELLLRAGARVNAVNAANATPLHEAAVHGAKSCVEACVMFGADCSAPDRFGSTPLHAAARYGHLEVVRLLISAGSDHAARDELGMSARQLAKQQTRALRKSDSNLQSSMAVYSEIARVLTEENLETAAESTLLRALQVRTTCFACYPDLRSADN